MVVTRAPSTGLSFLKAFQIVRISKARRGILAPDVNREGTEFVEKYLG
jgi:hypothetical protein